MLLWISAFDIEIFNVYLSDSIFGMKVRVNTSSLKSRLLDLSKDHDRFIAFVEGAVRLYNGRSHESSAKVLYVFEIEGFDQHIGLGQAFYLGGQLFVLVHPHLEPVVGHGLCLRFEEQQVF